MTSPQELINAHMRTIAHRVINVFEDADVHLPKEGDK